MKSEREHARDREKERKGREGGREAFGKQLQIRGSRTPQNFSDHAEPYVHHTSYIHDRTIDVSLIRLFPNSAGNKEHVSIAEHTLLYAKPQDVTGHSDFQFADVPEAEQLR